MKQMLRKALAWLMMAAAVCAWVPACASETEMTLGNEITGYLTTNGTFFSVSSFDTAGEALDDDAQAIGYCQYRCFDASPLSEMILTMTGIRRDQFPAESTLADHLTSLINAALSSFAGEFTSPAYSSTALRLSEECSAVLLYIFESDTDDNGVFVAIPYGPTGNYGLYCMENVAFADETLDAIEWLLRTFVPGTV